MFIKLIRLPLYHASNTAGINIKNMKTLTIIAALTLSTLFASAQTGNTIVQSGKTVVKLDSNRIAYVLSKTKNVSVRLALTSGNQTIRNNSQADIIVSILKSCK